MRIVIVDDDREFVTLIKFLFEQEGHTVWTFYDYQQALAGWKRAHPHLMLIDVDLQNGNNGTELCHTIRADSTVPIIMISGKYRDTDDEVKGLNLGADLYLTKPIEPKRLTAYVKALRYRAQARPEEELSSLDPILGAGDARLNGSDIQIHLESYEVYKGNNKITLTATEFRLLYVLMSNRGRVLSPDFICERLWGSDEPELTRTLKTHISRLRDKLGDNARDARYIGTIVGLGYVFKT
jgi:two-component system alkaline phosphatase synthesis response regulator PhoP